MHPGRFARLVLLVTGTTLWASASSRALVISALGDSTTSGTPFYLSPAERPPDGAGNPHAPYTWQLTQHHPNWTVRNFGIAGQRTEQIAARLDDALAKDPDYVVLLAGVNDIYQGVPLEQIEKNLQATYTAIRGRGAIPIAVTVLPFTRATPDQAGRLRALNRWIQSFAHQARIPLCDGFAATAKGIDSDQLRGSPDGLHPDVPTYAALGDAVTRTLEDLTSRASPGAAD